MATLEQRITRVEERNERVEGDKAWETSKTRRALIVIATYIVIGSFLWAARVPDPWLNAIVPSLAFVLSTLSLDYLKKYWLARHG
ncbi:hypothetical protein AUJ14_01490 [Candidatus Micrarchaeota archaeon CG1_02_55_22]|nr:MAG: hypothetical protein AUJ14_01490 [Candidatus Micrarchaeota archaeon CG1_02_55_22]